MLLENGIDGYGDWFILYNKNSGLAGDPCPEPFAFSEDELSKGITRIDSLGRYTVKLEKYNFERFQELITIGSIHH